jgi:predicted branched-subunit amino acid permease
MKKHPDLMDVLTAMVLIVVGLPLAASMLFIFIGAPMVMAGTELLTPRTG